MNINCTVIVLSHLVVVMAYSYATKLMWDRDRDQNGSLYVMLNLHTTTYV